MSIAARKRLFVGILIGTLLMITTACSGSTDPGFVPVPTRTAPPIAIATNPFVPESTATIPFGLLEFYDFSELPSNLPNGDFIVDGKKMGVIGLLSGQYRISVSGSDSLIYSPSDLVMVDARVEADVAKIGGSPDDGWGLFCRFTDKEHFYAFMIFSGGRYSIEKVRGDTWLPLGAPEPEYSSALNQGSASNHIRIDCNGDVLTLEANGELVAAVKDSEYKAGQVGMFASVFEGMSVDVLFDNLAIFNP